MITTQIVKELELLTIIVNYGMGSKILEQVKKIGLPGGTILPANGTVKHPFLNFLSLYDEEKEVVLIAASREKRASIQTLLNQKFRFDKPHHGLLFSIPIRALYGSRFYAVTEEGLEEEKEKAMYHLITAIVERGNAEDVIEAAETAGSQGGTILNGRGSGINETSRLFNMDIEPEKEVVWIISQVGDSEAIVTSIRQRLRMDEPGQGIIFTQVLSDVYGLYQESKRS